MYKPTNKRIPLLEPLLKQLVNSDNEQIQVPNEKKTCG